MKKKSIIRLLCGLILPALAHCGEPEQKFRVTVTDEAGKPMSGVPCKAFFERQKEEGKNPFYPVNGTTDARGVVELQGETIWYQSSVEAKLDGCYPCFAAKHWAQKNIGGKWQPWPVELNFTMRKIIRPHPMYFYTEYDGRSSVPIPDKKLDREFGYDLIERDWVSPHGKGKTADFLITASHQKPGDTGDYPNGTYHLKFSNRGDGIIEYKNASSGGSILEGPHEAPEVGYLPEFEFRNWLDEEAEKLRKDGKWSLPMYVFRIRTVTTPDGKIVSARYGKLRGGVLGWLSLRRPVVKLTYYLNGTDNDRGLEWDMKNNLFKDLQGKCSLMGGNKP